LMVAGISNALAEMLPKACVDRCFGRRSGCLNVRAALLSSTMPILSASFLQVNCAIARIELQA